MLSRHFLDSLQSPQWGWTGWSLHCRTSKHLSLAQDLGYPGRKRVAFGPGLLWLQNGRWASALPWSVWGPWGLKLQMAFLRADRLSLCRGVGVWPPRLGIVVLAGSGSSSPGSSSLSWLGCRNFTSKQPWRGSGMHRTPGEVSMKQSSLARCSRFLSHIFFLT